MARCLPPIEHRFKKGEKSGNHTQKGPYLTNILKKLLRGEMPAKDEKTKKLLEQLGLKPNIAAWLMLRLTLNGTEGETRAIEYILDRVDGKMPTPIQTIESDAELLESEIEIVKNGNKKEAIERFGKFIT